MQEKERHEKLEWFGPFAYDLQKGIMTNNPVLERRAKAVLDGPGVYYILAYHLAYGPRSLIYIGKSKSLRGRVDNHSWLANEWEVEVYVAGVKPESLSDVETLLIWAHEPSSNAQHIATSNVRDLRIWNYGTCPRLIPEVSAGHPFFSPDRESPRPFGSAP